MARPLIPRTDTERLDLLVELIGFGRARAEVSLGWGGENRDGALELHAGPAGHFQKFLAEDVNGDLRKLLDRALSKKVAAKPRAKRRRKKS